MYFYDDDDDGDDGDSDGDGDGLIHTHSLPHSNLHSWQSVHAFFFSSGVSDADEVPGY